MNLCNKLTHPLSFQRLNASNTSLLATSSHMDLEWTKLVTSSLDITFHMPSLATIMYLKKGVVKEVGKPVWADYRVKREKGW